LDGNQLRIFTMNREIFHKDFKAQPFWWEAHRPRSLPELTLPREARVVIVGAGYAGLSAALELTALGLDCLVLDANEPGFGASTRNGGMVSGGVNVGKRYLSKPMPADEAAPFLADAADAFTLIEDLIAREKIDCGWTKAGYFLGAWCKSHYDDMAKKVDYLNASAKSDSYLVPQERQREEIGSDYYRGGMVVGRAAHIHPALFFKGLLELCQKRGVKIASKTPVTKLTQTGMGWSVETPRGTISAGDVIIATNGYTGDITPQLKRRVVPVGSYIIATEELPPDLAATLSPKNRSIADTRRVLTYYRMSPDKKRLIFGGRAKFGHTDPVETAPILYQFMTDRYPQLKGVKITHAWTGNVAFTLDEMPHMGKFDNLHYALGCNGSGIAMMTYLGQQTARKVAGKSNRVCAFDRPEFPDHPLYNGSTWFLPFVGRYFRARDWIDRRLG
jgi:glycine/D-amino acid oxidase-like deaminating enzyme